MPKFCRTVPSGPASLACAALFLLPCVASADPSFGDASPVDAAAFGDEETLSSVPDIATDDAGKWIAVWTEGSLANELWETQIASSTDAGRTWSAPEVVFSETSWEFATDNIVYANGVWMVGHDGVIRRSLDGGLTWGPDFQALGSVPDTVRMVTDEAGTWILVADQGLAGNGGDREIVFVRSVDDGATWSAQAAINDDAATDQDDLSRDPEDRYPDIATDGQGVWVAVWRKDVDVPNDRILVSRSIDNGATWSAVTPLPSTSVGPRPRVGTDGLGNWLILADLCLDSADSGATWTARADPSDCPADIGEIVAKGDRWYVFGERLSRSSDGGATWSYGGVVGMTTDKDLDQQGFNRAELQTASDSSGNWVGVWNSSQTGFRTYGVDNHLDTDWDVLVTRARELCAPTPETNCSTVRAAVRGKVKLRSNKTRLDKENLSFAANFTGIVPGDVSDPVLDTDYAFCLYDRRVGGARLELEKTMFGGETCAQKDCWLPASNGVLYKDPIIRQGPVRKFQIKTLSDGRAKLKLKAKAHTLGAPVLPLEVSPEFVAQVVTSDDRTCFEAVFSAPKANDEDRVLARF